MEARQSIIPRSDYEFWSVLLWDIIIAVKFKYKTYSRWHETGMYPSPFSCYTERLLTASVTEYFWKQKSMIAYDELTNCNWEDASISSQEDLRSDFLFKKWMDGELNRKKPSWLIWMNFIGSSFFPVKTAAFRVARALGKFDWLTTYVLGFTYK